MNSIEYPIQNPSLPDDGETKRKEKFMLAKNVVQLYFANLDYHNRHPDEEDVPELEREKTIETYGQEFEQWYESEEGKSALASYVEEHDSEAIIHKKNIDELVRSFLIFRNRSSR
ncbi:MAG: hypothetical protein COZ29_01160 [Candidatus Moranbacteria bacterium CG_4_10_14_3_um_filter_45_9]|nr:MAG: hypothetical protein COZ29_01160 [Candidatus Moranbacteria bacterium CG_4_10_14_3_um_filter_45_9]